MDTYTPGPPDDLSDLERRLSGWRPAAEGLNPDAALFAAGLAAGRRGRGRLFWPAVCGLLAVVAAGLGGWALSERAERRALADRLREPAPAPAMPPAADRPVPPAPAPEPSPGDYLSTRRRMEEDQTNWLASLYPAERQPPGPPPPGPAVLTPGQRDSLFEQ